MTKKRIISIAAALLLALPVFAVFDEKDLPQTLSVLRYELHQEYAKIGSKRGAIDNRTGDQHDQIVKMLKQCNELSLILYSQNPDFTFDVTYSLREVTDQVEAFKKDKVPYEDMISHFDLEIEKYENLIKSLRRLPPIVIDPEDSLARFRMMSDSLKVVTDSIRAEMNDGSLAAGMRMMGRPDSTFRNRSKFFVLDEQGQADRDSCLWYAKNLLDMYQAAKIRVLVDNEHYENASARLDESHEYAKKRYKDIQRKIFIEGQDNIFMVLKDFRTYVADAMQDVRQKYSTAFDVDDRSVVSNSEWRGPMVLGFIGLVIMYIIVSTILALIVMLLLRCFIKKWRQPEFKNRRPYVTMLVAFLFFTISIIVAGNAIEHNFFRLASNLLLVFGWLVTAIFASLLVRVDNDKMHDSFFLHLPLMVLGLIVIVCRIIFIPNSFINLVLPPILLIVFLWQLIVNRRTRDKVDRIDMTLAWISLVVVGATTIVAFAGYVLMAVVVMMWWLFQYAAIETVIAIYDILEKYYDKFIETELAERRKVHKSEISNKKKGYYINVTWMYDLITMAAVPVIAVMSLPLCLRLAAGIFDLGEAFNDLLRKDFVNLVDTKGNVILQLSVFKIVLVTGLFFIFKYVAYALRSFYRRIKFEKLRRESGNEFVRANQVNLTLANNLFSILVWGTYAIVAIRLMKIPMGAISIVAAGLATGIGLALKDVLNNFIYGIQLMSGRLRVGDYVECDGVRGRVERISYQSTEIETINGAIMAFTNTTLFNKNFINLTKNNSYEFAKVIVGVAYGTDVSVAREVLLKAIEELRVKDKFGRDVIDPGRPVSVVVDTLADSSVNLAVKQYVLVEEKVAYMARATEVIYRALGEAGIEIPFPQRDVTVTMSKD